jgi:LysR family cys regulon transcriptional activator
MKLRQLYYVREVARAGLNMTAAANVLYTSQPGISKEVRMLEDELGIAIFVRSGKQLTGLTPAGERVLEHTSRLLAEVDNLKNVAQEFQDSASGSLSIATTHTQARYALPSVISRFRERYPRVALHLHEGSPSQIAKLSANGEADFAIATEGLEHFSQLAMLPCYHWNRCILARRDHPLSSCRLISLSDIAAYPIITYTFGFTGRSKLDQSFAAAGLRPNVVLTAVDADVIKTYVRLGLGIGIVASMAYDATTDRDLVRLSADHLFEPSTTYIGFRQGTFLREYMYDFVRDFAPHLTKQHIDGAASITDPVERLRYTQHLTDCLLTI